MEWSKVEDWWWKGKARNEPPPPPRSKMTVEEAREILGVKVGATPDEIRAAAEFFLVRERLVFPDDEPGEAERNSARIEAAREVLLKL